MPELKPCMVWTHNDRGLSSLVLGLARACGFKPYRTDMENPSESYVFGVWRHDVKPTNIFNASRWGFSLWEQHPDWPRYDAHTQMGQIREHFGAEPAEPEWDESPMPYDMKKEKADEIRKKFNLSPEQWEMFPPSVRDALAGAKVTIKVAKSDHVWHPMSEPKENSNTVVVCRGGGREGVFSGGLCGIGCFSGDEYAPIYGESNPTHWADIPTE